MMTAEAGRVHFKTNRVSPVVRMTVVLAAALAMVVAGSGCKIKRIGELQADTSPGGFDPARYASDNWETRVLPYFRSESHPLAEVIKAVRTDIGVAGTTFGHRAAAEGSAWNFIVKGSGTIASKDTGSRAGKITVVVDGTSPAEEVVLQIGPVVRGSAIRDSLPFINFQSFTNQLEFADVGKALTARAMEQIAPALGEKNVGSRIDFTGAMSLNTGSEAIVITPVVLGPLASGQAE